MGLARVADCLWVVPDRRHPAQILVILMPQPYQERRSGLRDADAGGQWRERYECACRQFKQREISVAVFGAYLYGLGFRSAELQIEINLSFPEEK